MFRRSQQNNRRSQQNKTKNGGAWERTALLNEYALCLRFALQSPCGHHTQSQSQDGNNKHETLSVSTNATLLHCCRATRLEQKTEWERHDMTTLDFVKRTKYGRDSRLGHDRTIKEATDRDGCTTNKVDSSVEEYNGNPRGSEAD